MALGLVSSLSRCSDGEPKLTTILLYLLGPSSLVIKPCPCLLAVPPFATANEAQLWFLFLGLRQLSGTGIILDAYMAVVIGTIGYGHRVAGTSAMRTWYNCRQMTKMSLTLRCCCCATQSALSGIVIIFTIHAILKTLGVTSPEYQWRPYAAHY